MLPALRREGRRGPRIVGVQIARRADSSAALIFEMTLARARVEAVREGMPEVLTFLDPQASLLTGSESDHPLVDGRGNRASIRAGSPRGCSLGGAEGDVARGGRSISRFRKPLHFAWRRFEDSAFMPRPSWCRE